MKFQADKWPMLAKGRYVLGGEVYVRGSVGVAVRTVMREFCEGASVDELAKKYVAVPKAIEQAIRYAMQHDLAPPLRP